MGLDGHFKKHVLGVGNEDIGEPQRWFTLLNLTGRVTRAQLAGLAHNQAFYIFSALNVAGGTVLTAPQVSSLLDLKNGRCVYNETTRPDTRYAA